MHHTADNCSGKEREDPSTPATKNSKRVMKCRAGRRVPTTPSPNISETTAEERPIKTTANLKPKSLFFDSDDENDEPSQPTAKPPLDPVNTPSTTKVTHDDDELSIQIEEISVTPSQDITEAAIGHYKEATKLLDSMVQTHVAMRRAYP
jgi:hypothetical protein